MGYLPCQHCVLLEDTAESILVIPWHFSEHNTATMFLFFLVSFQSGEAVHKDAVGNFCFCCARFLHLWVGAITKMQGKGSARSSYFSILLAKGG
jgi:hypothetical protein